MALGDLQKNLTLALKGISEPEMKAKLAVFAKDSLADMQKKGEASQDYDRFVNGRSGVPEEAVVLPGPILYVFKWFDEVAVYAMAFLKARWPVLGPGRGGHFKDSYFIMGGGKEIRLEEVNKYNEIIIVNDKPYARKAQIGYKGFLLPRGMFEDCRQAVARKFGRRLLSVQLKFIPLTGGYVLKRRKKKTNATGRSVGEEMRYPALVISMKD